MRYVITGGLGMIGSALARRLLEVGDQVVVIDDLSRGDERNLGGCIDHEDLDVVVGDAAERETWAAVHAALGGDRPSGVFHLAARIGGVAKMHSAPYDQARNAVVDHAVLERTREYGCRLVYASTACVYPTTLQTAEHAGRLLKEDDVWPAEPESLYGLLKLAGEEMVRALARQHGLEAVIVRMFNAVGPEHCAIDERHVIPALLGKLARGDDELEVWGDGTAERSFLDARDAAEALELCMSVAPVTDMQAYNVGTEWRVTIGDVAFRCVRASDTEAAVVFDPSKPTGVHGRAASLKRIRGLGWKPKRTLDDTIRWVWGELVAARDVEIPEAG